MTELELENWNLRQQLNREKGAKRYAMNMAEFPAPSPTYNRIDLRAQAKGFERMDGEYLLEQLQNEQRVTQNYILENQKLRLQAKEIQNQYDRQIQDLQRINVDLSLKLKKKRPPVKHTSYQEAFDAGVMLGKDSWYNEGWHAAHKHWKGRMAQYREYGFLAVMLIFTLFLIFKVVTLN